MPTQLLKVWTAKSSKDGRSRLTKPNPVTKGDDTAEEIEVAAEEDEVEDGVSSNSFSKSKPGYSP